MEDFKIYYKDEYVDHKVYRELAKREKNEHRKKLLQSLSEKEYEHYQFWSKYVDDSYVPKVNRFFLFSLIILKFLFGLTFTLKLLERHEKYVITNYKNLLPLLKEKDRPILESIIKDEQEHENFFVSQLDERVVRYMSFIVLGLADAIIEITGVHAGFLGVTSSTLIAGIAGLVVGFAAAISMASASYLQARHDPTKKPILSAFFTGIAYIAAVTLLALPYFLTKDMLYAFTVSLAFAIIMIASFTFYGAVVAERSFSREFLLSVGLTFGTALGAFLFGEFLGGIFGIKQYISF
ncbi:MAG: VIT1/CCC1 family protein [Nitrososphaerales archaeon]